jgi:flagellar biosynthesis component FlhA
MAIESNLTSNLITKEEAMAQKTTLLQNNDFSESLACTSKLLLRFCLANILTVIIVIFSSILVVYLTGNTDALFVLNNLWRYTVLLFNAFFLILPVLFMGLSVFTAHYSTT